MSYNVTKTRNYGRKSNKVYYPQKTLETGIEEIKTGRIESYKTGKKYDMPYHTILDHIKGRCGVESRSLGCKIKHKIQKKVNKKTGCNTKTLVSDATYKWW